MKKVSVIGTGRLGSAVAYTIAQRRLADEIVLVDRNQEFARGHAQDIAQSVALQSDTNVAAGGYNDVSGSDVVVITCGMPIGAVIKHDRMTHFEKNKALVKGIADELKKCVQGAAIITATNPSDVMNHLVQKTTGFSEKKIMGFGNLLDSARFRLILAEWLGCKVSEIENAFVVGEHGEAMVPLFSKVKIRGRARGFSDKEKGEMAILLRNAAWTIVDLTGATVFGPASCIADTVGAVLNGTKEILPVSVVQNGFSIGVLARVGKCGAEPIEMNLDADEKTAFELAKKKLQGAVLKEAI